MNACKFKVCVSLQAQETGCCVSAVVEVWKAGSLRKTLGKNMPNTTLGKNNHDVPFFWHARIYTKIFFFLFAVAFAFVLIQFCLFSIRCSFLLAEKGQEFVSNIQLQGPRRNGAVSIQYFYMHLTNQVVVDFAEYRIRT